MKTFTITQKCPIMFGDGASLRAVDKFNELGCKKVLLVTDKGVLKLGLHTSVVDTIRSTGIEVVIFDDVIPDPSDEIINKGGQLFSQEKCDAILGLGGGSSLDTAKGIKVLSGNPAPINQYYGKVPMHEGVPLILIPTTMGTGSEVSIAAVISDTASGKKLAILNPALQANLAIVDPQLSKNAPKFLIACSGMDIFLHAVETITSNYRNLSSTIMAKASLEIVVENVNLAVEEGTNDEACANLAFASSYVALAFNDAMIHVGHHIAHTLGAFFHTAHGECCAITAPALCKYFAIKMPKEMKMVAKSIGLNPESKTLGDDLSNEIKRFNKSLGLHTAKELGYDLDKMLTMIPAVHARVVELNSSTPFDVTEVDLRDILLDIYNS